MAFFIIKQDRKFVICNIWKCSGVKNDDFNNLYKNFIDTKCCDKCNVKLSKGYYVCEKQRCLNYNKKTGEVIGVICLKCNVNKKK